MASPIFNVIEWTNSNGEVKAIDRLRVMLLPEFLDEGLTVTGIGPETTCSAALLKRARTVAAEIVGQPCPA